MGNGRLEPVYCPDAPLRCLVAALRGDSSLMVDRPEQSWPQMARPQMAWPQMNLGSQMAGSQMALGLKWPGPKWPGPKWPGPKWARPKWSPNGAPQKHGFVEEWFPKLRLGGLLRPKWIVWYPGGLWENQFPGFPQCWGKMGRSPWAPLYIPYWPFVGCLLAVDAEAN